jgi:hypothetical protein
VGHPFTSPAGLVVGALAVARLTRLITEDELTQPLRQRITGWAEGTAQRRARPAVGYLVTCPWCVSPYLALGWLALTATAPASAAAAGAVLAWSEVSGLLAEVV